MGQNTNGVNMKWQMYLFIRSVKFHSLFYYYYHVISPSYSYDKKWGFIDVHVKQLIGKDRPHKCFIRFDTKRCFFI